MKRICLKIGLHILLLLSTLVLALRHGQYVLVRPETLDHRYAALYIVLFCSPLLARLFTRRGYWLHLPGLAVVLLGLYVICGLTPQMDRHGEPLTSFDARLGALRPGWTQQEVPAKVGQPDAGKVEADGEIWEYRWEGREGGNAFSVWGDGVCYTVTFTKVGIVKELSRDTYGWDVMSARLLVFFPVVDVVLVVMWLVALTGSIMLSREGGNRHTHP